VKRTFLIAIVPVFLSASFFLFSGSSVRTPKRTTVEVLLKSKIETIQCPDSTCYSRGIFVVESEIFTANSNGTVYCFDLEKKTFSIYGSAGTLEELRDVELVDGKIIALQSGSTGKLLRVDRNVGASEVQEYDMWRNVFLDGMDFFKKTGFIMGDPVNDQFSLYATADGGISWQACEGKVHAQKGEAGYAASGSNVQVLNDSTFLFVTGGSASRFIKSVDGGKNWTSVGLPFASRDGSGPFSVCFRNEKQGVAVGGDWQKPEQVLSTACYTNDGGTTWEPAEAGGYRSCVIYCRAIYYSCGTNGIDYSKDSGKSWKALLHGNYYALAADQNYLYATSSKGRIKKIKLLK
jgi:hypothetical protein